MEKVREYGFIRCGCDIYDIMRECFKVYDGVINYVVF